MGKFDGVLLVSDYDDTLYNCRLEVSRCNRDAIDYFIDEGGRFTVATGRAYETFLPQIERENLHLNAPVILSNGSLIYDFQANNLIYQSCLPKASLDHICQVMDIFPELGFESYHQGKIFVHNPNEVSRQHLKRVDAPYTVCQHIKDMPMPWIKLILEQDHPLLVQVQTYILERWGHLYEAIFSNLYLLELTAKGNTKGALVKRVADILGIKADHVYCIGDNQNDIPMLAVSAIPFAPANCALEVQEWGPRIVRHCDEDAVAHVIEILDDLYGVS